MGTKRKKRKRTKRLVAARDPYWRVRRALGSSRVESRKAYRRAATRDATRRLLDDA